MPKIKYAGRGERKSCNALVRAMTPAVGIIGLRDYREGGLLEGWEPQTISSAVSWLTIHGFLERVGYGLYRRSRRGLV